MLASATVAVCEDDDELRGILKASLEREGYIVRATASGKEAVAAYAARPPDLLVLDVGLPDADGRDVCQALRAQGFDGPVLFLTARDGLADRLSGFRSGGDDYLTKPFALAELLARVEVLLRRARARGDEKPDSAQADGLGAALDPAAHALAGGDGWTPLTPTEFRLLAALAASSGAVLRRRELVRVGWPEGAIVNDNTLDAYVSRIRAKLRAAGRTERIVNVRGVGYVLR